MFRPLDLQVMPIRPVLLPAEPMDASGCVLVWLYDCAAPGTPHNFSVILWQRYRLWQFKPH
jgi:hypothetical protein